MSFDKNAVPWQLPRFQNWVAVGRLNQLVRKRVGDALSEQGLDLPSYDVRSAVFRFPGLTQPNWRTSYWWGGLTCLRSYLIWRYKVYSDVNQMKLKNEHVLFT
jgi:hypothetical protein